MLSSSSQVYGVFIVRREWRAVKPLFGLDLRGFRVDSPAPPLDNRAVATDPVHELITSIRTRVEAELNAHAPALAARYEQTLAEARKAAEAEADHRWSQLLDTHKAQARQELQAAVSEARAEGQQDHALLDGFREIDAVRSLSAVLTAVVQAAGARSSRARLFVGAELEPWNTDRTEAALPEALLPSLHEAAATGRVVRHAGQGIAVPLVLEGTAVAVLHAEAEHQTPAWVETIELLVRYGAAHVGYLTALRTAQAQRWLGSPGQRGDGASHARAPEAARGIGSAVEEDTVQSAKRYARLLVSEIKLYNEAAVREGREQRDLARRLAPDIERARRLYEERVPASVVDRAQHFQHELVQTLAGGDPALLG